MLNINASPFHLRKIEDRKRLISGHATKYKLPIIYANQVGGEDELVFDGTSMAMDGNGKQVLQLDKFKGFSIYPLLKMMMFSWKMKWLFPKIMNLKGLSGSSYWSEGLYRKKQIPWSNYRIIRWD